MFNNGMVVSAQIIFHEYGKLSKQIPEESLFILNFARPSSSYCRILKMRLYYLKKWGVFRL